MAPVNLDYQVPWTPQFALNNRSRAARRQVPGSARPKPLSDARGTYDEAVAVQPGLPAVTVASLSPNKPPRISSDPDLSLCVISGRDERPNVDLDVSESDNTLPPLEQLIESFNTEQLKCKSSPEAVQTLPAGDGTLADKGCRLLASSTEPSCDGDDIANANCLTSSTSGLYHVSPTTSPTTPPLSHTPHESCVSHDYCCTSYPVDPALMACHRGEADAPTEVPRACGSSQSICSLETFGGGLYGCEVDVAASNLSLATAAEEKRCQVDIETSGQHLPGEEWPGNSLPYFGTSGHQHGSTTRSDDASSGILSGQTPRDVHRWTEEHADTLQRPRKRRRVEPPTRALPSPPVSTSTDNDADEVSEVAEFEEWPLENVLLKRIMVDGVATFQLQFDWNLCTQHCRSSLVHPKRIPQDANHSGSKRRKSGVQNKFTSDEDDLIIKLKEELQLSWTEIHRRHTKQYPGRSRGSLQVRYSTKLKCRKGSKGR